MTPEVEKAIARIVSKLSFEMRGRGEIDRHYAEQDIHLIASELNKSDPCQHEIRKRASTVGGMLECAKCGFLWKHDPVKDIAIPFDPTICECCGQTKPKV